MSNLPSMKVAGVTKTVLKTVTLPATTSDVSKMLSSQLAKDQFEHRKCDLKLLPNVRFLS